jgi:hypothetical protein
MYTLYKMQKYQIQIKLAKKINEISSKNIASALTATQLDKFDTYLRLLVGTSKCYSLYGLLLHTNFI